MSLNRHFDQGTEPTEEPDAVGRLEPDSEGERKRLIYRLVFAVHRRIWIAGYRA